VCHHRLRSTKSSRRSLSLSAAPRTSFVRLALRERYQHVAISLRSFESDNEMELIANAADEVNTQQVEDLLSPVLNVPKVGRWFVPRVE
jgi:hypothetical protein